MSSIDLDKIAANYAALSDHKLTHLCINNAKGLHPDALLLLEKEIKLRGLSPLLIEAAQKQQKALTVGQVEEKAREIQQFPCPHCGSFQDPINATRTFHVRSFLVITSSSSLVEIGCKKCLDKKHESAINNTLALGWWGFPWGLLKTPWYIYKNYENKSKNHITEPSETLQQFVADNYGELTAYQNDKAAMNHLLQKANKL